MEVDEGARRKKLDWRAPVIGVGIAIAVIVGFGACTAIIGQLNFGIGRQGLAPIPVPASACPYLRRIHTVAAKLGDQWMRALDGRDPWPAFRLELAAELPMLEVAATRAKPHVPAPIADKLETMILDLRLGRAGLPHATSALDYVFFPAGGKSVVSDGDNALSDASDLVGNACGFPLASAFNSP